MYTRQLRGQVHIRPAKGQGPSARIHVWVFGQNTRHDLRPMGITFPQAACLIDFGRYTWLLGFGVSWGLLLDKSKYDWEQTWDFDRTNFRHEITEHNFTLASL